MKKHVPYYRVSKDSFKSGKSKSEGLGLSAQESIVKHFFGDSIVKEFVETKSAKNITDRPILQEAIDYCLKNDCCLVIAKLDRLSRNVDDVRSIVKQLNGNISFCDIPCEGKIDMFTLTLFAALAERERLIIGLRTSQALQEKIKRGESWHNTEKRKQYEKDFILSGEMNKRSVEASKKKANENPHNLRAIRVILQDKIQNPNITLSEIANNLNKNKFFSSTGSKFYPTQVKRLLDRATRRTQEVSPFELTIK